MNKNYLIEGFVVLGVIAPVIAFNFFETPFMVIFLFWCVLCFFGAIFCTHSKLQLVLIYAGACFFTLGIFGGHLAIKTKPAAKTEVITTPKRSGPGGYYQNNDFLGHSPAPNFQANAKKTHGEETIYDVKYTIESNGLRKSPPFRGGENAPCILFFGGSFTFGEGVNDEEAMPYRVGIKTGGDYRIYNFGFHGYGPHQMLSAIEHGLVKKAIQCKPRFIIYQALLEHVLRSAGMVSWDQHGPRYTIGETGEVSFTGNFDDDKLMPDSATKILKKSQIYVQAFGEQRAINQSDIDIYLGIIKKSRKLLKTQYPEATFHILFWESKLWNENQVAAHRILINGFKNNQIPVHVLSNILPEFHDNQANYELSPHDHHPNPNSHDLIAQYLVEKIIH